MNENDTPVRPVIGSTVTVRGIVQPSGHLNPNPVVLVDFNPNRPDAQSCAVVPLDRVTVANPDEPTNKHALIRVTNDDDVNGVYIRDVSENGAYPWRLVSSIGDFGMSYSYYDFRDARITVLYPGEPDE